jgi:hypothetical protein
VTVFTDTRVSAMRRELEEILKADKSTKNAHFAANFVAGGEILTITIRQGEGEVSVDAATKADFAFEGHPDDWTTYFATRPASHSSLMAMLMATDVSAGLVPSTLTASGDMEALFANLPIYNRIIESAIEGGAK